MRKVKRQAPAAPAPGAGPRVERHPMLRRAPLVEVGPDDPVWRGSVSAQADLDQAVAGGAIVRLCPPAHPGVDAEAVAADLRADGCAVRVAPAQVADAVVPRAARAAVAPRSHRQVVLDLVAEADAAERPALGALVAEVLGEVGL